MPELPEVETVRLSLEPHLLNRRITAATLFRDDIVTGDRTPRALLQGATITRLARRGKQLAIIADDGRTLVVHLGMSGQLIHTPSTPGGKHSDLPTHTHALWLITNPRSPGASPAQLLFRDPRRFGGLTTLHNSTDLESSLWRDLGPDALDITADHLAATLAGSDRAIKAALLDQGILAGVGNIYADEALFMAAIRPSRRCTSLRAPELNRLTAAIRKTLTAAIAARGSTLRDFVSADGQPGGYRAAHAVYGRGRQPCTRCRAVLRQITLAQRTTVYCPACQPARPRAGAR